MKKTLVALLLCAAMLVVLSVAQATPLVNNEAVFVPLNVSDIPNLPDVPTIPTFSNLREENGHLVVDVDNNGATYSYENPNLDDMFFSCYTPDDLESEIEFTYDAVTSTFVSETMPSFSLDEARISYACFLEDKEGYIGDYISTDFDADFNMDGISLTTNSDGILQQYIWEDGQLVVWDNWRNKCIVRFDEKGNMRNYSYEVRLSDGNPLDVTYRADGTLIECPVEIDGKTFLYFYDEDTKTGTWFYESDDDWYTFYECDDYSGVPAPEGYDLAKLTEMYPPLTIGRPEPTPTPSSYKWYSHNTLGLIGLPLRDLYPELTDKWYNVVPVDLTRQGTQTFPLAASNLYYMGSACVEVSGDSVTVTYETPSGQWKPYLKVEDETLAWFTSAADITADFLNNPASETKFGEAVSIAGDLKGQDVALLFICNHVTYRQPFFGETGYLTRYWPNLTQWKEYRQNLQTLMTYLPE